MLANDLRVLFMKYVWVCFGVWVLLLGCWRFFLIPKITQLRLEKVLHCSSGLASQ